MELTLRNITKFFRPKSVLVAAALYSLPCGWARVALAAGITASAWWPVRAVLRNNGNLRRRLWRSIGA